MHIKTAMINPELRVVGTLIRVILPRFTERKFRLAKWPIARKKGKCRSQLNYEQIYITRADVSMLRLCIYTPSTRHENVPGLLWLHGGAYAMGTPEQDERFIARFVQSSACVVVSPDYRLSIEAPYPAALEDSYLALLWLKEHGGEYGMRSDQIMVGGDSAGGGLAAALALFARDKAEVSIAFQMLLYPMLDDRMNTHSATDNDAPIWNSKSNEISWKLYLGDLYGKESVPVYAAPARSPELRGLPPACSYVGSIEPFRDETIDYIERLQAAGIQVDFAVFDACFHGFDILFPRTKVAIEATNFLMTCFAYACEHYFAVQQTEESALSD